MKITSWILINLFTIVSIWSQEENNFQARELYIYPTKEKITLDGELNEAVWSSTDKTSDFNMHAPIDGVPASKVTEVQLTHSDAAIYLAALIYDDQNHVINTLKRDNFGEDDSFFIILDPLNQKANGYGFGTNVLGAMTEVLATPNGNDDSWDNKWKVATKQYADYWVVEMEIPFKSMRFEKGKSEWGVNFGRLDPGNFETHVWSPIPRQFAPTDIGYCGKLIWEEAPKAQGANIALIPYVTLSTNKDYDPETPPQTRLNAGGDVKVALTTGLNLDLTLNPDFSQVEVDQQQTNLTQFNIFFPERRQFFIENADIFGNYGQFANQPFYSRRIGLDNFGSPVPILYGARLTGNVNKTLRIGAFNIHTKGRDDGLTSAQNFSAFTFQQAIGKRSNVKGIYLNRHAFEQGERLQDDFGRNAGGEINLISDDGKLAGQLGYIHSFRAEDADKNKHIYGRFDYNGKNFRTFLFIQNLGKDYYSDMGFNARINNYNPIANEVVRIGYTQIGNMLDYYYYPTDAKLVNYHWSGIENFIIVNEGGFLNQWYTRFRHFIFFKNSSQLRFRINHIYDHLVFPFALTQTPLPAKEYDQWEINTQFNTDVRKALNLWANITYGDFYEGKKLTYRAQLNYRIQPWANFNVSLEQNRIRMPAPYGDLDINLASAKMEINFSTSLFWTSFVQYNTQAQNFNVNTRLQWRYAPMSDLFLVYTDNYLVDGMFGPKNKSLVLKLNYWLGI